MNLPSSAHSYGELVARVFRVNNAETVGPLIYRVDLYVDRIKKLNVLQWFILLIGFPITPYVVVFRIWFWVGHSRTVGFSHLIWLDLFFLIVCLYAWKILFSTFYFNGIIPAHSTNHPAIQSIVLPGNISSLYLTSDDIRLEWEQKRKLEMEELRRIEERDIKVSTAFKIMANIFSEEVERSMVKEEVNIQNLKEQEDMEKLKEQDQLVAMIRAMRENGTPVSVTDTSILGKI